MIHQRTEAGVLILTGSDDADRPEMERHAREGLARGLVVNVFRDLRGEKVLLGSIRRIADGFRMRGPQASDTRRTAEAAVWLALSRFPVDHLGGLARV